MILLSILLFFFLLGGTLLLIRREQGSRKVLERKLNHLNAQLKKALDDLEETRARLETTFSGMVEGVLLTDQRGDILHLNPAFREMFGLKGPV
jgi:PAS domain-containing protein